MRRLGDLADQLDDVPDVVAVRRPGARGRRAGGPGGRLAVGRRGAQGPLGVARRLAGGAQRGVPGRQVHFRAPEPWLLQLAADGAQGGPLDQLHRVEPLVGLDARGEDLDQVRVLDPAQGVDLAVEPGLGLRVAGLEQALQRHLPAERRLPGAVDDPHAAAAQLAQELELAQPAPWRFLRGRGGSGGSSACELAAHCSTCAGSTSMPRTRASSARCSSPRSVRSTTRPG